MINVDVVAELLAVLIVTLFTLLGGGYYFKKYKPQKDMENDGKHHEIINGITSLKTSLDDMGKDLETVKGKVQNIDRYHDKFATLFRFKAEICKKNNKDEGYVALFNSLFPERKV